MSQICGMSKFSKWRKKRRHFGNITGPFSPTVTPFATEGGVEASGGEIGKV
jgi:hypothetical protein